ncbi:hypothetical protein C6P45_005409, partial [Maudiozyma exigua]
MLSNINKVNFKYLMESLLVKLRMRSITQPHVQLNDIASDETNALQPSTPPTAIPLTTIVKRLPGLFPRSISDSYADYKRFQTDQEQIQNDLLNTLPMFQDMASTKSDSKVAKLYKIPIDTKENYINELYIEPRTKNVKSKDLKHLILIHGYGAGLGFFIKNLENLPLLNNEWCIHAIDLPGFGYSSRPRFPFKYGVTDVSEVNEWFHSRINNWMKKRSLLENPQNNIVMAHSLGAYLMALYANKYPGHFKKLIMCSPAGVCYSNNVLKNKMSKTLQPNANLSPPWWYSKLWNMNFSPFSLVRNSGPLGSLITSGWSYRRFKQLLQSDKRDREQFELLHRYAYGIFNRAGSGEYLLPFVLGCGGVPREPLEESVFKDVNNPAHFKANCDWIWMYGENDWMNKDGAEAITTNINRKVGNSTSKVLVVPNS